MFGREHCQTGGRLPDVKKETSLCVRACVLVYLLFFLGTSKAKKALFISAARDCSLNVEIATQVIEWLFLLWKIKHSAM